MHSSAAKRTLIYISIVHDPADMGTLGARLPRAPTQRERTGQIWNQIDRQVRSLGLDWQRVKLYQDGLPDAGPEMVRKILAEVQSPNYVLLRWLIVQGAELLGTESPTLLKEEYSLLQDVLKTKEADSKARARRRYVERSAALLAERDAYIARLIDETLPPGGVGLLFIGVAHRVAPRLPADIVVQKFSDDRSDSGPRAPCRPTAK